MTQETAESSYSFKTNEGACFVMDVSHVEQASNWDCGLACIQMVLSNELADYLKHNLNSICPEEFQSKSTWTIDLCYILNHFSVKQKYYTKTLGVNPTFSQEKFYNNYIAKDETRVNQRFEAAASKGIIIELNSLDLNDLIHHIKCGGVAIALIDANLLECISCKSFANNFGNFFRNLFKTQPSFSGHYIVICGFDIDKKLIYYRDPAVKSELCYLPYQAFEKARQAHGTDEDIILIYR